MKKAYFILIVFLGSIICIPTLATDRTDENNTNKTSSPRIRPTGICRELILKSLHRSEKNDKTVRAYQGEGYISAIFDLESPITFIQITDEKGSILYRTNVSPSMQQECVLDIRSLKSGKKYHITFYTNNKIHCFGNFFIE